MLDLMAHRGSDFRNIRAERDFCLGAQSSDLSAARGDGFASADGVVLVFDG